MTAPQRPPADTTDWTFVLDRECPQCGYDSAVDPTSTGERIRAMLPRWQAALARPEATGRPSPQVWSTLEYGCHVRDVLALFAQRLALMLDTDGARFVNWDQDEAAIDGRYWEQDPAQVAEELTQAGEVAAAAFDAVGDDEWDRRGVRSDGAEFTVATFARYFLHDLTHHLWDVERLT